MTTQTAPKLEAQHPPLARDTLGNLLAVPDGTCAWRILRETTGRPREIRGPDKQPFRFPLDTTGDELVEMCGSGVYRVYALDEVGAQLAEEHVARWDLTPGTREQRNGAPDVPMLASLRNSAAPTAATDLRFALEAMTQMMRTNSDALRIVTESHVDLAKTIATAKGLPRNAAYMLPQQLETDDDDDDDDEPPAEKPRQFIELLMPLAQEAAKIVPALVAGRVMGNATQAAEPKALDATPEGQESDEELASRPDWEARDLMNLNYASRKAQAKRNVKEQAAARASAMKAMQDRIVNDPALLQQLMAIKGQLAADEVETLMGAIALTTADEQAKFLDAIKTLPVEEAVAVCRDVITAIREQRVG
jgi:hypothetical protein